jgi:hypothetical protein
MQVASDKILSLLPQCALGVGWESGMTRYGTRLNVLWVVCALLIILSQSKKASEGDGFAIALTLAAAIFGGVALIAAVRSSRQSRK